MFLFLKKMILFCGLLLLGLEIVFRFVFPAANMPYGQQIKDFGIMALERGGATSGHNTMGRFSRPAFRWQVNQAGFNSAIEYVAGADRALPCAVVVGNSYVQGLYGNVEDHLAGQLHQKMSGLMEVYNLGTSGMPFSQAPLVARFAADRYSPELIIIQTGSGSVTNSLRRNGKVPYCQQYSFQDGELVTHPPSKFVVNRKNRLARHSALVRYLYYNANYNLGGKGLVQDAVQQDRDAPAPTVSESLSAPLGLALRAAVSEIRAAAPEARVLVLCDADRKSMYTAGAKPARLVNSPLLENVCEESGFAFLDLTESFWTEYQRSGKKFNFEDNYHWNPYGISVVTEAIMTKLATMGIVQQP